jgi:hypothetical protein
LSPGFQGQSLGNIRKKKKRQNIISDKGIKIKWQKENNPRGTPTEKVSRNISECGLLKTVRLMLTQNTRQP